MVSMIAQLHSTVCISP